MSSALCFIYLSSFFASFLALIIIYSLLYQMLIETPDEAYLGLEKSLSHRHDYMDSGIISSVVAVVISVVDCFACVRVKS